MENEAIKQILNEIFSLQAPPFNPDRRPQVLSVIDNTINGDAVQAYVVFNALLGEKKGTGALVYVLTNLRLIVTTQVFF